MTTDEVIGKIIEEETKLKLNEDFYLSYCPERVLPGKILYELKNNDRIVGSSSEKAQKITKELYESILTTGKAYTTNTHTAEMCKLVENSYRDVNIAFANELSVIADKIGINVFELIELANKHPRVNILKPGAGVGGHCLAVDPWFIVEKFPEESSLIRTAREKNDYKPQWVVEKVEKELKEKYPNKEKEITIGILGLSYKPNIDDLRESPSIEIALTLKEKGYNVVGCEPNVLKEEIKGIKNLSLNETLEKSNYLVLTLAHDEFKQNIDLIMSKEVLNVVGLK
jgi:UDP-N-acetyl-D-mannosaminuronic acid dehydrogenase